MRTKPWYDSYEILRSEVESLREEFRQICKRIGQNETVVLIGAARDIIARIVFESNWQEGIHVDRGRTKELADVVFEDFGELGEPRLDFASVLNQHRKQVLALKRKHITENELAAYNLAAAHHALWWISADLIERESACLAAALKKLETGYDQIKDQIPADSRQSIERGFQLIRKKPEVSGPPLAPMAGRLVTQGDVFQRYLSLDFEELLHPLREDYLHFLHRLLLMGILPPVKIGVFRKHGVHVSNPDLFFPPAQAVPALMSEYCRNFPFLHRPGEDDILSAATHSYRFVRIHPYSDGNGRVSRLLMNLIYLRRISTRVS